MRRYGLVDIPDQASDIDAVPITRTITINGTTFDLSADRTYTVGGMAIGGTITSATPGSVLFAGASGVLAQDNPNFFWDDTNNYLGIGTNTPLVGLHYKTALTTSPRGIISEQTSNDAIASVLTLRKIRGTSTVVNGDAIGSFQSDAYDGTQYTSGSRIRFLVDGAVSNNVVPTAMQFYTGSSGSGTERARITSTGKLLLGHTIESIYLLDVQGENSRFGGITNFTLLYSQANGGGIGLIKSDIFLTNSIQNEFHIEAGVNSGDAIRMYMTDVLVPGTVRPLCVNGNQRETVFGSDTTTNTASSLVTLVSTTKGFLPPRMTSAQRTAISSPASGLIVYQTDSTFGLYLRGLSTWSRLGTGDGTVTSVSIVSANGLAGTVATSTSTPAITLSTTVTGLLKGDGTSISSAVANTDYQSPITLTTTGSSGNASFVGNNLNIPNYTSTSSPTSNGTYTPTISATSNCGNFTTSSLHYFNVGNVVHVAGKINFNPSTTTNTFTFKMSIPVSANLTTDRFCGGTCVRELATSGGTVSAGSIQGGGSNLVQFFFATANSTAITDWYFTFTYLIAGA